MVYHSEFVLEKKIMYKNAIPNHFAMSKNESYLKENIHKNSFDRLYFLPSNGSDDNTL